MGSDEDDVTDDAEYLDRLSNNMKKKSPFPVTSATIEDDDVSDDEEEDGAEETALEDYTTPLDDEDSPVDEYVVFKDVMHSKIFFIYIYK